MEIINWQNYFDEIWCINYLPYKTRRTAILKEFQRLGILNHKNFKFKDTFDSPWYTFLWQCIKNTNTGKLLNANQLKCAIGHYSCIKTSLENNSNRILIIEDDSRFLKDVNKIKEILDNIPNNADIILFDYFIHCDMHTFQQYKNNKINTYYSIFNTKLSSCGCYSLSKNAIQKITNSYEHNMLPADIYTSQLFSNNELLKCFSLKQLSCQVTYRKSMSFNNAGNNTIHNMYIKNNINYNEYNMNDGKNYNYGDYIIENE